jgi:hypothetical protein
MKKLLILVTLAALFASFSCSQTPRMAEEEKGSAAISFETTEHDFGIIMEGAQASFNFVFKNTGKAPLVLNNVRSSCGCTVPEWPTRPILKGDEGRIKVSYNTRVIGTFSKKITVYSNASETPIVLSVKGTVEMAE